MPERPWEAEFIRLWEGGAPPEQIAQALHIPEGTVRSRAFTLQKEGKIGTRPRGGRRARGEQAPAAVQGTVQSSVGLSAQSVQSSAVQTALHGAWTVSHGAELPIPASLTVELERLWAAIEALRQEMHRPVHGTVQSLPEPLFEDPTDNTTERWNLYLKHGLRVRIEALAQAREIAPSRVVQEILWKALSGEQSATS
jgi:hypothetical protein